MALRGITLYSVIFSLKLAAFLLMSQWQRVCAFKMEHTQYQENGKMMIDHLDFGVFPDKHQCLKALNPNMISIKLDYVIL